MRSDHHHHAQLRTRIRALCDVLNHDVCTQGGMLETVESGGEAAQMVAMPLNPPMEAIDADAGGEPLPLPLRPRCPYAARCGVYSLVAAPPASQSSSYVAT